MNKNKLVLNIALGLLVGSGLYAHQPCKEKDPCVIDSIVYLEDEAEVDLGFDVTDYLPEDFDPYTFYFDLNSVEFLEDEEIDFDTKMYLPKDFDPYSNPKDFRNISYIDPEDDNEIIIDRHNNLPVGFDAYISK